MTPFLVFTTCKPFQGEFAVLQRNAILTWRKLGLEVLIIGDEPGTAEIADEAGCHHVEAVERNSNGIPYIHSLFQIAHDFSDHTNLCFINSDILLSSPTCDGIQQFLRQASSLGNYLFVTRRRSLPLLQDIHDKPAPWTQLLEEKDNTSGVWDPPFAIDVFMFNKGWLKEIPRMTVGRAGWDNWMLQNARDCGAAVVDGSYDCPVYHPTHGYAPGAGGLDAVTIGPQAAENRQSLNLAGGRIDTSATLALKKGKLGPVPENFAENFANTDPVRRVLSDLEMIHHYRDDSAARIYENMRTLLWRAESWVPPSTDNVPLKPALVASLVEATEAAKSRQLREALKIIQKALAADLLAWFENRQQAGTSIYIWGTGQAAHRFCTFVEDQTLEITGFVDGVSSESGGFTDVWRGMPKPVLTAEEAAKMVKESRLAPAFYIASVHYQAIASQLDAFGARKDIDYR